MKQFLLSIVILQGYLYLASSYELACYINPRQTKGDSYNISLCSIVYLTNYYPSAADGSIDYESWRDKEATFVALKATKPIKLVGVLMDNHFSDIFTEIAKKDAAIAEYATGCGNLAKKNHDGLNFHWQDSKPSDKVGMVKILNALKTEMTKLSKPLTVTVSGKLSYLQSHYDASKICSSVDFVNVLIYEAGEEAGKTELISALSLADTIATKWIDAGCKPSQILIGCNAFGSEYELNKPATLQPGSNGLNGLSYPADKSTREQVNRRVDYRVYCKHKDYLVQKIKPYQTTIIDGNFVYLFDIDKRKWGSGETPDTIVGKANLIKTKGLAGASIGDLFRVAGGDDYENKCGQGAFPITTALSKALNVSK